MAGLFCLALGEIIVWAGLFYVFPALLIQWENDLGWSRSELTAALTLAILMSAVAAPVAGRIIDRGRGPLMMSLSAAFGGGLLIFLSVVTKPIWFYVTWAGIGVSLAGCLYEPCFALITRALGSNARQSILTVTLIAGFASTLSFPGAHALEAAVGWRYTLIIFGSIVIILGAPLLAVGAGAVERMGPRTTQNQVAKSQSTKSYFQTPVFWLLGIGFACVALVHGILLHHLLPLLHERNLDADIAVTAAAFIGPMQVAARLAMMTGFRNIATHALIIGCFSILILAIAVLSQSGTDYFLLGVFVLFFGSAYGMVSILRPVAAHELLGGDAYGAKSGILASLYLGAAASAPYLGSVIWSIGGYELVILLVLLTALSGLSFYLYAFRKASQATR